MIIFHLLNAPELYRSSYIFYKVAIIRFTFWGFEEIFEIVVVVAVATHVMNDIHILVPFTFLMRWVKFCSMHWLLESRVKTTSHRQTPNGNHHHKIIEKSRVKNVFMLKKHHKIGFNIRIYGLMWYNKHKHLLSLPDLAPMNIHLSTLTLSILFRQNYNVRYSCSF